ncbi:MAG: YggU family protein [Nanoarchaeota archaeon]|nr:YggU family protein [Nanoarchaeota archaeon]MBU1623019.1 YggU family protein [Nanoarchaeota archaeon]MBU1974263.1 YggU family protein [Nanoarchaeota archaeon]
MNIKKYIVNDLLKVKVIPNSKQTELKEDNQKLKLYLKAIPDKNKANKELIKFFKKEFSLKVEIKSGKKSREKTLKIY